MSTLTSHTFGLHPARAGSLRQVIVQRLKQGGHSVWRALEQMGRARAAAELRRTAQHVQLTRPELAKTLRDLAEPMAR